jgi:DNA polymerase-1
MKEGPKIVLKDVSLHLVESYEDVTACLEWLATTQSDRLGFDTETTGLSPETDTVRLIQFGDAFHGWAFELDRWYGLAEEVVARWIASGRRFVAHNARYDVAMLRGHRLHIPIHLVDDTMMLAHIADPTVSIGLKQQSARHVDKRSASMQGQLDSVMKSGGWTWATIPIAPKGPVSAYWVYAALDPVLAVRLWDHHAPSVLAESPRAYDLEVSVGWVADRMERAGLLVDRSYTLDQGEEFAKRYVELTDRAQTEFGVDPGSREQIIRRFLDDKVDLWKTTPGGDFSLDKEVMAGIDHPLARLLLQRRKVEKLQSTYLRRFLEYSEHDGRLHPSINTLGFSEQSAGAFGVITSRMSMSHPNLQQLPRGKDPLSRVIRNCIVAGEGKTLLMVDFDQVELRIMAHLSADPGLAAAFATEDDFFTTLTRGIYKDPGIHKDDVRRQLTKSYVYATLYGAGNDKLATTTGVPLAEIEQLSRDFAESYSGVPAFQQEVQRRARLRARDEGMPYTRSPLTNRRFIGDTGSEYKLVNFTIQGMAAEILKTKLLELDAAGLGDVLRLPVHDEVIVEVDHADVEDAVHILNGVMNDADMLTIPLTAGVSIGERWGSKVDYVPAA